MSDSLRRLTLALLRGVARSARSWQRLAAVALALAVAVPPGWAQTALAQATDVAPPPAGKLFSDQELDELVARVALYPDPLLAIVLPASTNALGIVQAQRFLDQNTGEQPPEDWDPAIVSLCNYPEVVQMMSDDLDWTQALGDAVAGQQADVMDAVQQARAQAQAAGNLQTSEQQKVIVEKEIVKIVPADPQVIYVPQYNPQVIYAPSPTPVVSYYPPRPCYWCQAAAFGTGMFIGATTAAVGAALTAPFWAFDWHHHDIGWGHHHGGNDFDFDIDRSIDVNNNITNINKNVVNKGNGNQWKPDKNRPGNRPGGGSKPSRPNRPEGGWNNPNRPGAGGGGRPGAGRPSTKPGERPGAGAGGRPGASGQRPGAGGGGRPSTLPSKERPSGVAGRPTTRPAERPGGGRPGAERPGGGQQRPSTRPAQTRPGGQQTREAKGMGGYGRGQDAVKQSQRGSASRGKSGSMQARGDGGGRSMSDYKGGGKASARSDRGSKSRGGGRKGGDGGGGHKGGGGGGGHKGGGKKR
jgi:hypothetical protein